MRPTESLLTAGEQTPTRLKGERRRRSRCLRLDGHPSRPTRTLAVEWKLRAAAGKQWTIIWLPGRRGCASMSLAKANSAKGEERTSNCCRPLAHQSVNGQRAPSAPPAAIKSNLPMCRAAQRMVPACVSAAAELAAILWLHRHAHIDTKLQLRPPIPSHAVSLFFQICCYS